MFCWKCGSEIREGAKFCTKCGSSQDRSSRHVDSIGQTIDQVSDRLGDTIDRAASEIRQDFSRMYEENHNTTSNASKRFNTVSKESAISTDNTATGIKRYLTVDNMEKLTAISLFVPLICLAIGIVIYLLKGILNVIGNYSLRENLPIILNVLFDIALGIVDIAALVAVVYILISFVHKRSAYAYVTLAMVSLNVVAFFMIILRDKYPVLLTVGIVISAIVVIWGVDLVPRVIMQGEGIESGPNIGRDMSEYGEFFKKLKESSESEQREAELAIIHNPGEASYFDGRGIELIGNMILFIIVSGITCGIGTPWMLCRIYRWRKSHTVINGRRLAFTGTGGGLLGRWILWTILTIVTCGLFSLVEHVFLLRWEMDNTRYADETGTNGRFEGEWAAYIGYGIVQSIILCITCGLAWPWTTTMITKWETKNSVVGRDHMKYDGTALGLLGTYLLVWLLDIITFGIYSAWGVCRLNRYIYSHIHVDHSEG